MTACCSKISSTTQIKKKTDSLFEQKGCADWLCNKTLMNFSAGVHDVICLGQYLFFCCISLYVHQLKSPSLYNKDLKVILRSFKFTLKSNVHIMISFFGN